MVTFAQIFTGRVPFYELQRDSTVMLKVKQGLQPTRPALSSSSWTEWGLIEEIWQLMEDCWNEDASLRPSIDGVITQLGPKSPVDARPIIEGQESISPSHFRQAVSGQVQQYPSIKDLHAILASSVGEILP